MRRIVSLLLACISIGAIAVILAWRSQGHACSSAQLVKSDPAFPAKCLTLDEIEAKAKDAPTPEKLEALLGVADKVDVKGAFTAYLYIAKDGRIRFIFSKDALGPAVARSNH
jgi:hypothetical protein